MGCSGSTIDSPLRVLERKPHVWFISGGPGSGKTKIIQYLIRDYKFLYVSAFEIIEIEKTAKSADAERIEQIIKEKRNFPSQLIVKLLKKALASQQPRRVLIDGFPRKKQDISQFQNQLTSKDIILGKLIHLEVPLEKMKAAGLDAKKDSKSSPEQIEKQVDLIIQEYRKSTSEVNEYFQRHNQLLKAAVTQSADEVYRNLRLSLSDANLQTVQSGQSQVFFAHFDDPNQKQTICGHLIRKYGMYFYDCQELIATANLYKKSDASKTIKAKSQQKQEAPVDWILQLIRRQVERKDYKGNFLIVGFPRTITDAEEWNRTFGWEISVKGYLNFCISNKRLRQLFFKNAKDTKPEVQIEEVVRSFESYKKNRQILCEHFKGQDLLFEANTEQVVNCGEPIEKFLFKRHCHPRMKRSDTNLVFVSTLNNTGSRISQSVHQNTRVINMSYLYQEQINDKGLYSQLIQSMLQAGNPLPGFLAVRVLLKNILNLSDQIVIVKGFPNSVEQLLAWQEQIGQEFPEPKILHFQTDFSEGQDASNSRGVISEILKKAIFQNSTQLEKTIQKTNWKSLKIRHSTKKEEISAFVNGNDK